MCWERKVLQKPNKLHSMLMPSYWIAEIPNLAVKELGGTGRTHNWKVSRKIVESVDIPVFLAGGIKADNLQFGL